MGAAVRDALRFPLAGKSLSSLVRPGGTATILVEPHALPIPGTARDPRQAAIAAASDELDRLGVPTERQTAAGRGRARPAATAPRGSRASSRPSSRSASAAR